MKFSRKLISQNLCGLRQIGNGYSIKSFNSKTCNFDKKKNKTKNYVHEKPGNNNENLCQSKLNRILVIFLFKYDDILVFIQNDYKGIEYNLYLMII